MVTGSRHLLYEERLKWLSIHSLYRRRLRTNLITAIKVFTGLLGVDQNCFFLPPIWCSLRGHSSKVRATAGGEGQPFRWRLWKLEATPGFRRYVSFFQEKVGWNLFPPPRITPLLTKNPYFQHPLHITYQQSSFLHVTRLPVLPLVSSGPLCPTFLIILNNNQKTKDDTKGKRSRIEKHALISVFVSWYNSGRVGFMAEVKPGCANLISGWLV